MRRRTYLGVLASSPLLSSIPSISKEDRVRSLCRLYGVDIDSIDSGSDYLDYLIRLDSDDSTEFFNRIEKKTDADEVMVSYGKVLFFAEDLREACSLVSHMSSEYNVECLDKDGYTSYYIFTDEDEWSVQWGHKQDDPDDVYVLDFADGEDEVGDSSAVYGSEVRYRVWREYYEA